MKAVLESELLDLAQYIRCRFSILGYNEFTYPYKTEQGWKEGLKESAVCRLMALFKILQFSDDAVFGIFLHSIALYNLCVERLEHSPHEVLVSSTLVSQSIFSSSSNSVSITKNNCISTRNHNIPERNSYAFPLKHQPLEQRFSSHPGRLSSLVSSLSSPSLCRPLHPLHQVSFQTSAQAPEVGNRTQDRHFSPQQKPLLPPLPPPSVSSSSSLADHLEDCGNLLLPSCSLSLDNETDSKKKKNDNNPNQSSNDVTTAPPPFSSCSSSTDSDSMHSPPPADCFNMLAAQLDVFLACIYLSAAIFDEEEKITLVQLVSPFYQSACIAPPWAVPSVSTTTAAAATQKVNFFGDGLASNDFHPSAVLSGYCLSGGRRDAARIDPTWRDPTYRVGSSVKSSLPVSMIVNQPAWMASGSTQHHISTARPTLEEHLKKIVLLSSLILRKVNFRLSVNTLLPFCSSENKKNHNHEKADCKSNNRDHGQEESNEVVSLSPHTSSPRPSRCVPRLVSSQEIEAEACHLSSAHSDTAKKMGQNEVSIFQLWCEQMRENLTSVATEASKTSILASLNAVTVEVGCRFYDLLNWRKSNPLELLVIFQFQLQQQKQHARALSLIQQRQASSSSSSSCHTTITFDTLNEDEKKSEESKKHDSVSSSRLPFSVTIPHAALSLWVPPLLLSSPSASRQVTALVKKEEEEEQTARGIEESVFEPRTAMKIHHQQQCSSSFNTTVTTKNKATPNTTLPFNHNNNNNNNNSIYNNNNSGFNSRHVEEEGKKEESVVAFQRNPSKPQLGCLSAGLQSSDLTFLSTAASTTSIVEAGMSKTPSCPHQQTSPSNTYSSPNITTASTAAGGSSSTNLNHYSVSPPTDFCAFRNSSFDPPMTDQSCTLTYINSNNNTYCINNHGNSIIGSSPSYYNHISSTATPAAAVSVKDHSTIMTQIKHQTRKSKTFHNLKHADSWASFSGDFDDDDDDDNEYGNQVDCATGLIFSSRRCNSSSKNNPQQNSYHHVNAGCCDDGVVGVQQQASPSLPRSSSQVAAGSGQVFVCPSAPVAATATRSAVSSSSSSSTLRLKCADGQQQQPSGSSLSHSRNKTGSSSKIMDFFNYDFYSHHLECDDDDEAEYNPDIVVGSKFHTPFTMLNDNNNKQKCSSQKEYETSVNVSPSSQKLDVVFSQQSLSGGFVSSPQQQWNQSKVEDKTVNTCQQKQDCFGGNQEDDDDEMDDYNLMFFKECANSRKIFF